MTVAMARIFSLLPQTARSSSSESCWRSSLSSETSRFFSIAFLIATSSAISPSDRRRLVAARQHDHLGLGTRGFQRPQRRHPVETRHHDVEQHHVGRLVLLHGGEQLIAAGVAAGLVSTQGQEGAQVLREPRIIIDDRDVRLFHCVCFDCKIGRVSNPFPTPFKTRTSTEPISRERSAEVGNTMPISAVFCWYID
jgi:hypothetical protein